MDVLHYLKHIELNVGEIGPSVELLKEIHKKHLLKVPFENLDIITGRKLSMNPEDIYKKIILEKRGGICYETNTLMYSILQMIGFNVKRVSACFWNAEQSKWNPDFSHLALIISIDENDYLFDVGIGGGFIEPLLLKDGFAYSDVNGSYQVVNSEENEFLLRHLVESEWTDFLKINTYERDQNEFSEQCAYFQTSKETIFTQKRIVSKTTLNGKVTLTDKSLKLTENSNVSITEIIDEEEWTEVLQKTFGISIDNMAIFK
ncbi:arylamine N-acetyltransferase [Bacillus sp. RG28]|uniref:Arylamine N-acetyltransferase n=1 Tax=Gottfriedia endophytica TaxID=2820819 RepID=A0A940SI16_9BACI|nr:arylamine N-acetyltransferase [Gottfriedia endophytica]MBP0724520.1 arylamine N-acetyltransferase [Gottfriedia endophytica]